MRNRAVIRPRRSRNPACPGAGGALGQVLRDSRTGDYVATLIASTPIPPVLLPFLVATLVRLVQGSGTVAIFWVVNRLLGIDEVKDQIRVWSVPTTIGWAISGVLVTVLSLIVPA